ncbi:MAG TPA: hypothetical protein VF268_07970 [Gammaproteobacteria bacterium]
MILWCYLVWYLVTVVYYFDPSPAIWVNSLGISLVIGFALVLSVKGAGSGRVSSWQTFRLFLMPFCVSSFSSLIKGRGYILIVPPEPPALAASVGCCAVFVMFVLGVKYANKRGDKPNG